MNAIIGLCHFCEAHGPRPLFCSFTTADENNTTESSKVGVQCNGCTSLGPETVMVSKDDNGTIFCSRESIPNPDVAMFLRKAAIRSITCEASWSKEGGVVYFSDTQGHVLSLTFQLRDTRARGLKRWFSIIVLMKDKMLLLNITPLLSEHMQKLAKELQQMADVVFDEEQKICSQRSLRLKTGRNDFGQSRSLVQLTGCDNVFNMVHSHFSWMLKAGALTYSENLYRSQDLLNKLHPQATKGTFESNSFIISDNEDCIPLRKLEHLLSAEVFRILLYCTLTGVSTQIYLNNLDALSVVKSLARLLPVTDQNIPHITTNRGNELPSECIIEQINETNFCYKWTQTLPHKCPTLMARIETAIRNSKFDDAVLHQHIKSLVLEWLGIAKALKSAMESSSSGQKSESMIKLKQIFGVTQHDEKLLNYWMKTFCRN